MIYIKIFLYTYVFKILLKNYVILTKEYLHFVLSTRLHDLNFAFPNNKAIISFTNRLAIASVPNIGF